MGSRQNMTHAAALRRDGIVRGTVTQVTFPGYSGVRPAARAICGGPLRYNLLGQTGLYVSELCLGTMTFGRGPGIWESIGGLQIDEVCTLMRKSFDAGINFFDTANVYSLGKSESLTGEALHRLGLPRDEVIIATKATGSMSDAPNSRGQSRYHLMSALDASLERLQLDHVDLYQLHGLDILTPIDDVLSTLNDMVRSGKVRYIGLCNLAAWYIMKALGISDRRGWSRFESVQAYYTIAGRDLEREVVPLLQDQKLGLMVWSPLAGGLLTGKYDANGKGPEGARRTTFDFPQVDMPRAARCVEVMRGIAQFHQVSVARIALAWLLAKPWVSTVIIGARTVEQLDDNIASTRVQLRDEDVQRLDEVSALPSEYPGWMLSWQTQARAKPPVKV
jgi:aryl-alcohol dehydrogenase-like predicted oxidoreductase